MDGRPVETEPFVFGVRMAIRTLGRIAVVSRALLASDLLQFFFKVGSFLGITNRISAESDHSSDDGWTAEFDREAHRLSGKAKMLVSFINHLS